MERFVDLHTHTAHSREADNFLPERLRNIVKAKAKMPDLAIVGIVDHDTLNHIEPMHRALREFELRTLPLILPGIEITSSFRAPWDERQEIATHVLGYFPSLVQRNWTALEKINAALGPSMIMALKGKMTKNIDLRLRYFFSNEIIPNSFTFEEIMSEVQRRYQADIAFVEAREPKKGDIINWPVNTSDMLVIDTLLALGIIRSRAEGKLYTDRRSKKKADQLAAILQCEYRLDRNTATKLAEKRQGCCHGSYNDPFERLTTANSVELITKAGGVAVMAHPHISVQQAGDVKKYLAYCREYLLQLGLKGMELYYPGADGGGQTAYALFKFCADHGLYITGGSDDHQDGRNFIGETRCPARSCEGLLAK